MSETVTTPSGIVESIGTKLATLLGSVVPLALAEAATDVYPYATYSQTLNYRRSKDEVCMISADTEINVYAKAFSDADTAAASIISTLETSMRDDTYVATLRSVNKDCTNGIWDFQLNYTIKQLK